MHILLDTNIYLGDPTYSKPEHEAIKNYLSTANAKIIIPETVKLEVEKNLKKIAASDLRKLKALTPVRLKQIETIPTFEEITEKLLEKNQSFIRSRSIEISHDNISLTDLFQRSLNETPPFKPESKGFRDALIWASLLNYLTATVDTQVAFISNNTSDFGKNELKQELRQELTELGHSERVFYFNNLNDFLATYGKIIEFINEDFIETVLSPDVEGYSDTIGESELEISYPDRQTHWTAVDIDFEDFEIESFYIYRATATHYFLYVDVVLNFSVSIDGEREMYRIDPMSGDYEQDVQFLQDVSHGYKSVEYEIKVHKVSHDVEIL